MDKPLAERLRPKNLSDYVGQTHLLGDKGPINGFVKGKRIPSIIFWGPPGVGKTTLSLLLANELQRTFYNLSAINSGVKEVREVIESAKKNAAFDRNAPILFIDEIHRFSKSQQDSLLAAVEQGIVTLIGATTENPSFEVISPLLSRCQVFILKALEKKELEQIVNHAFEKDTWLAEKGITKIETDALIAFSGGDARKLLNLIENVVSLLPDKEALTNELVKEVVKSNPLIYDKDGEQHFDIISAFIKSIRGSDPDAAVYWLARMISGGEDPKFIARRLIILASEDIGLANPNALLLADACFSAVEKIGMPESRIILSQCAIYLATSPKSNTSYAAINKAQQLVKETGNLPVPLHLRNAPTQLMKDLDYGVDYKYPHDYPNNFVSQNYMPEELKNKAIVNFAAQSKEQQLKNDYQAKWPNKK
ncbi:replication-associated recombination protein A [Luteibaculum oceani]|uniref:Replication-associated recombination protein A n=1 Tax=Luteibaculum oceani TaxID=1294296 RepID=A0A5C6V986_9FLAO|nr:replication-associated recombination protein A [Luteibaculum oceani]TXC82003.1 replication-associated recombination protein A [Luteibaculum oceani]